MQVHSMALPLYSVNPSCMPVNHCSIGRCTVEEVMLLAYCQSLLWFRCLLTLCRFGCAVEQENNWLNLLLSYFPTCSEIHIHMYSNGL